MNVSNSEKLMLEVADIINHMDQLDLSNPAEYAVLDESIRKYRSNVDSYVVDRTKELNDSKNEYLEQYKEKHNVYTYDGFHPLYGSDGKRLPVTKEGIAATSVLTAHTLLDDFSARLGALDSVEAFEYLVEDLELDGEEIAVDILPYDALKKSFANRMDVLDEVSVEKLIEIGYDVESEMNDVIEDLAIGFEDFAASADPDMMRDGNLLDQYKRSLRDASYESRVEDQQVTDRIYFTSVEQSDFRRSPISDIRNYEQLLFGLYDNDSQAVHSSGLKDAFEDAADQYFAGHEATALDLYIEDGTNDPQVNSEKFDKFLHFVSMEMGFSDHEAQHFVDLLNYEEMRYIEYGEMYASRGGMELTAKGNIEDRHKWLFEGFEEIYKQPIDYNVDYKRYLNSLREEELSEEQLQKMAVEMGVDMMDEIPEGGLFDVSLNKRMSKGFAATKENVTSLEEVALLVSQINLQEDDVDERIKQIFEEELNKTVSEWGHTEDTYITDADLFVDMMAHTVNRAVNAVELTKPKDEQQSTFTNGHSVVASTLGHNLDASDIQKFADNYRLVYDTPMDASLYTVNEVNVKMGRPERTDVAGEVDYYDLYKASSENEVRKLIAEKQSQLKQEVEDEIQQEVDGSMVDYNKALQDEREEQQLDEGPEL